MKIIVISLLIILTFFGCEISEREVTILYENVRVSAIGSVTPQEVTITINPKNPQNLAAGANNDYYYYSMNGGESWTEGRLTSSLGVFCDPAITFDRHGNLYYSHLSKPENGKIMDRIVIQKSTDGGKTWNDGTGAGFNPPKDQDKEWIIADHTSSKYKDNLYLSWTEFDKYGSEDINDRTRILCSCSNDSSETWSEPVVVSDETGDCIDSDNTVEGAVPAVGPGGEVYISWSGPLGIYFDRSFDGGKTFGKDILITYQPGGWNQDIPGIYRCNGMPVTLCDTSNSIFKGNVYIVWSDQRNGIDDTDIFIIKSTDGGENWSAPLRINDDGPGSHQFFPWATIDPKTGKLYVIFYDRRKTQGNDTEVYVAQSDDGGNTFRNYKVSELPFVPLKSVFFGDYLNIAAFDGMIYPIWARMDGTDRSIWIAIINDNKE